MKIKTIESERKFTSIDFISFFQSNITHIDTHFAPPNFNFVLFHFFFSELTYLPDEEDEDDT